jgi:hypothetical protein
VRFAVGEAVKLVESLVDRVHKKYDDSEATGDMKIRSM